MTPAAARGPSTALDPAVVAAIDNLELAARLIVEGARAGQHRSPFHGFSNEFSQYRAYRPGDDLKYLDWKVLARTDRLYTRQFRETTNMSVVLVVDASASMAYPSPDAGGLSKFRLAVVMAAALAHLVVTDGDAVGLMSMQVGKLVYVPPRGGKSHLRTVLAHLDRLTPTDTWDAPRVIARAADLLRRRGILVMVSDCYDDEDATQVELRRAARRGHEVVVLQTMSREEIELPFRSDLEFEDLESGRRVVVDARSARSAFRDAIAGFLTRWRTTARRDGFDYALMTTDEPPSESLRAFLLRRGQPR